MLTTEGGALTEVDVPFQASLFSTVMFFDLSIDELSASGNHYDVEVQVTNVDGSPVEWVCHSRSKAIYRSSDSD